MSNPEPLPENQSVVREAARDWFVRQLAPMSAEQRAAMAQWRAEPAHEAAFRAVEAAWRAAEAPGKRLAEQEAAELAGYLEAIDRAKRQRRTSRRLAALSVALLAVLGGAVWLQRPNLLQDMTADYVTQKGERRVVTLSDGSHMLLDADSAVDERFDAAQRRVRLLRGLAFFDVAAGERPFIVEAADAEIRDIGTSFDVGVSGEGGAVTLESGKVVVTTPAQEKPTVLAPGQRVRFGAAGLGSVEEVNLNDALAWRSGRYIFYRSRLADVVAEIARYRRGRVVIASSALGEQRVTGSFSLADTDAALASLQASVGFRMISVPGALTVIGP